LEKQEGATAREKYMGQHVRSVDDVDVITFSMITKDASAGEEVFHRTHIPPAIRKARPAQPHSGCGHDTAGHFI